MSSFFQFCYHQHNILSAIQPYGYSCSVTQSMSSTNTCNLHCDDTGCRRLYWTSEDFAIVLLSNSHRSMYGHPNVLLWSFLWIPNWPQWTTDYLKVSFVNPNAVDNFQYLPYLLPLSPAIDWFASHHPDWNIPWPNLPLFCTLDPPALLGVWRPGLLLLIWINSETTIDK